MVWVRAVVRVQLCVCTKTMLVMHDLIASRLGVESAVLVRVKGVGFTVARLKEAQGLVEVDVGEANGVVLFGAQNQVQPHSLKWDGFGPWVRSPHFAQAREQ